MQHLKTKLIRITTVPISLEKLLEGQLTFMQQFYNVTAISADKEKLQQLGERTKVPTYHIEMSRQITPIKDLMATYKLYKFLKKEKPHIVHSHTPKAGIVGMLAAYLAKVPVRLHTVAGLPLMEATGIKRKVLNFVEKSAYRLATKVYPNSKGLYDFILSARFATTEKLKVIGNGSSNGIDTNYFNPTIFSDIERKVLRQKLNIPISAFVFIFVGRLVGHKGINELVTAFSKLSLASKEVRLLLVGPLETELDALSDATLAEIHRNKNILSIGFQQDVRPYFAISNTLVFPSYREGFPNVVMQAGAMGLPSIVSNINGCNEIIIDGENGLIVPKKDTNALQKSMETLVLDNHLRNRLQLNARQHICSNYERMEVWAQILDEYRNLAKDN